MLTRTARTARTRALRVVIASVSCSYGACNTDVARSWRGVARSGGQTPRMSGHARMAGRRTQIVSAMIDTTSSASFNPSSTRGQSMGSQVLNGHVAQGGLAGRLKEDGRGDPSHSRLLPARRAKAPPVARPKAREVILRPRRHEVVAPAARVLEELLRHLGADHVPARVRGARLAAAVPAFATARDVRLRPSHNAKSISPRQCAARGPSRRLS